jgi:CheY-like chemotaxis protein
MKTRNTEQTQTAGNRALIIDDEPDIVFYLTVLLEDNGYEAVSATDPDEGLHRAEADPPDIILLDIMMPRKTGVTVYRDIKQNPRLCGIPVFIVSAFTRTRDFPAQQFQSMLKEFGLPEPEGYIDKPIDRDALLEKIQTVMAARGGAV